MRARGVFVVCVALGASACPHRRDGGPGGPGAQATAAESRAATGPIGATGAALEDSGNRKVKSFSEAKRHLRALYAAAPEARELYGGCALVGNDNGPSGSASRERRDDDGGDAGGADDEDGDERRAPEALGIARAGCCYDGKLELSWEHVVPAALFGRSSRAWRDGDPACVDARGRSFHGRKCASRVDAEFRRMEGDLHNLLPAIRALNEARGDLPLGDVEGEPRRFGSCDFELSASAAEPRPEVRGELARAYEYMDQAYPGRGIVADEAQRTLLAAWDAADPPDAWERERNSRIAAIQGNANPFVR